MRSPAAVARRRAYELARSNHLVIPLDGQRRWFRYHYLLRDLLARRLEELPAGATEAHRRAARWFESAGRLDDAIEHALAAGDADEAARLTLSAVDPLYASGELGKVRRWVGALPVEVVVARRSLVLVAALTDAFEGDANGANAWADAAGAASAASAGSVDDGGPDEALLRAVLCQHGPVQMLRAATDALITHDSGWRWRPAGQPGRRCGASDARR